MKLETCLNEEGEMEWIVEGCKKKGEIEWIVECCAVFACFLYVFIDSVLDEPQCSTMHDPHTFEWTI